MIKYNLECSCGETFESWFQNSNEYEKLLKKNLINCYVCGRSKTVKKSIMAPSVATSKTSVAEKDVEQKKEFFKNVKIPAKYGKKDSPLTTTLKPGSNKADFDLVD